MINTLKEVKTGEGLAANQVGIDYRIVVMKFNHDYKIMINPKIDNVEKSTERTNNEGCLSISNKITRVRRKKKLY